MVQRNYFHFQRFFSFLTHEREGGKTSGHVPGACCSDSQHVLKRQPACVEKAASMCVVVLGRPCR